MQQLLAGITMPSTPMQHSVGPVMGQQHQHQHQAPPSRNQHSGRRRAEAQNWRNTLPESLGSTTRGRSTDNAGAGSAQRSPSRNPSVVNRNPTMQQRQRKPYDRDRSNPSLRRQRTKPVGVWGPHDAFGSIHHLLPTTLYSRRNGTWFEYPCCNPISISTCCADVDSCIGYVGFDSRFWDARRGHGDQCKRKYARTYV